MVDRGERDNALAVFLEYILGLQAHQAATPSMSYANVKEWLSDVPCVGLDDLLGRYFDYFVKVGFLPGANEGKIPRFLDDDTTPSTYALGGKMEASGR